LSSAWSGGVTKTEGFSSENNWAYGAKTITHAGLGAGTGTAGMITFGTIVGGGSAMLTGGNFWQGAVTGLVVSGLNHAMHKMVSFGSEGKDPKLPPVEKYKNGTKIKGADGKVYQVHNNEWVKLDGVLIDVSPANLDMGLMKTQLVLTTNQ
jgi:hypothetical protein